MWLCTGGINERGHLAIKSMIGISCSGRQETSQVCLSVVCAYLSTLVGWVLTMAKSLAVKTSCFAQVKCFHWSSQWRSKEVPIGQAPF